MNTAILKIPEVVDIANSNKQLLVVLPMKQNAKQYW